MSSLGEGLAAAVGVTGAIAGSLWELWIVVTVWRGGELPVPFADWVVDPSPGAALVLFVFGWPIVATISYWATVVAMFVVAGPFLLLGRRQTGP